MGEAAAEDAEQLNLQPGSLPASKQCKRGHLRTPENVDPSGSCKECHRITSRAAHARYRASGKGRLVDARYNASTKGWATVRRYKLKGACEAIQVKLEALERQEEACRRYLGSLTQTK